METKENATMVEEIKAFAAKFAGIHQKMNCLVALTPDQRKAKRGMRLGARKLHLMQNRVAAAAANPGLLPGAFDLPTLQQDTAMSAALYDLLTVLKKIRDSVNDTLMVVGGPAGLVAAEANSHIKLASASAQRLAPTERGSKGRSSARQTAPVSMPVPVQPAQPVESGDLPVDSDSNAA
jgi:uncharacterized protein YejL (UPF0352 family)